MDHDKLILQEFLIEEDDIYLHFFADQRPKNNTDPLFNTWNSEDRFSNQ